ncbi:MAG: sigma-70 family RNA polymerase sigma factor [Bacteroidaceae bacterium]|nr:sigma-70 family RNA polymerase sigma factor [Bacteroidaceae bacterium]
MISFFRSYKLTDVAVVESVQRRDNAVMETFYHRCHSYFQAHAGALFIEESLLDDIFQDSMIHLWREIETRRIVVVEGKVCRMVQGMAQPMTGSLTTFLMSVAKRKHWEQLRRSHQQLNSDITAIDTSRYAEHPTDVSDDVLAEQIVSDSILMMTDRCREILTLFYYEQRSLDEILAQRTENTSKEGLKTSKYKCMNRLRQIVQQKFQTYGIRYR